MVKKKKDIFKKKNVKKLNLDLMIAKSNEKYNKDLRKRSKPKESWIVAQNCTIYSIKSVFIKRNVNPVSGIMMGCNSPGYDAGMAIRTTIGIKQNPAYGGPNDPVEILYFDGGVNLEKGDSIIAYFEKYKIEEEKWRSGIIVDGAVRNKIHYVDRELKKEETVQRIQKLSNNKLREVLAEYVSK